ncbi:hypothetical protein FOZ61_000921 [Perkinsus olseni]|uniref:Uncharacterized protein n=1 Tax=Perkinsus olseni TaxID=32597 RepID=A0A7J6MGI0_PEROL|nr:hypothetical protein FOZ61_000921 [Perkinsus olseni]KAF4673993.1 hypothetical protein FOL46_006029 [Perkinsus olseni]
MATPSHPRPGEHPTFQVTPPSQCVREQLAGTPYYSQPQAAPVSVSMGRLPSLIAELQIFTGGPEYPGSSPSRTMAYSDSFGISNFGITGIETDQDDRNGVPGRTHFSSPSRHIDGLKVSSNRGTKRRSAGCC